MHCYITVAHHYGNIAWGVDKPYVKHFFSEIPAYVCMQTTVFLEVLKMLLVLPIYFSDRIIEN